MDSQISITEKEILIYPCQGPILAVYSVQQPHTIICPFSKYLQILYSFAKFSNILPFFNIFLPFFWSFSENSHKWPYFLEQALHAMVTHKYGKYAIRYPTLNYFLLLFKCPKPIKTTQSKVQKAWEDSGSTPSLHSCKYPSNISSKVLQFL